MLSLERPIWLIRIVRLRIDLIHKSCFLRWCHVVTSVTLLCVFTSLNASQQRQKQENASLDSSLPCNHSLNSQSQELPALHHGPTPLVLLHVLGTSGELRVVAKASGIGEPNLIWHFIRRMLLFVVSFKCSLVSLQEARGLRGMLQRGVRRGHGLQEALLLNDTGRLFSIWAPEQRYLVITECKTRALNPKRNPRF